MVPFFVQIKCKLGQSYVVANALAEVEIASEIYSTAGHYDLLVKFYVDKDTDIGHFVNEKVQVIPGIQDTLTIITFKAFGGRLVQNVSFRRPEGFHPGSHVRLGLPEQDAATVAALMAQADMQGSDGHGVIRLPQYARRIRAGGINVQPEHPRRAGAGRDGADRRRQRHGPSGDERAPPRSRSRRRARPASAGSARNSATMPAPPRSMRSMPLAHDMIGLYFAVGNANHLPPWGGLDMLLSTNPIAAAIPAGDEQPIVLDMATTVAAYGKVKTKAQRGETMPEGWMIDRQGQPLTDPKRADEGFLLPIGGMTTRATASR